MSVLSLPSLSLKRCGLLAAAVAISVALSGCDLTQEHLKIDRDRGLEMQDYRDIFSQRNPTAPEDAQSAAGKVPEFEPYVLKERGDLKPMPLVSVSVNESIPLKDVLYELAAQADYDLILDPRIQGSIIFSARNRPLDVVIASIANIAGLRYEIDGDTLRVEIDSPYTRSYKIDYIPMSRTSSSQIDTSVSVASGQGGGSGGNTGGSKFQISNTIENDFWKDFDESIGEILKAAIDTSRLLRTDKSPRLQAATPPEAVEEIAEVEPPVDPSTPEGLESVVDDIVNGDDGTADGTETPETPAVPQLEIESIQEEPDSLATAGDAGESAGSAYTPYYKINRQASLLTVYANERTHRQVQDYVREITRQISAQVLIEAKILEVTLNDEFSTGIDWGEIELDGQTLGIQFSRPAFSTASGVGNLAALQFGNSDKAGQNDGLIQLISRYGAVHGLASPRLTVLNNQPAVLNVAKNRVYFELNIESSQNQATTSREVETEIKTVPEGVLINVFPSINLETNSVTMTLRPTISRISTFVDDPGARIAAVQASVGIVDPDLLESITNLRSQVPEVSVQEFDSMVRLNSGETIILGGLLQDRAVSTQEGVPGLSEMPLVGGLFRNQVDQIQKSEIIVMLKATILRAPGDSLHNTDRDFYRVFSGDRRPASDAY